MSVKKNVPLSLFLLLSFFFSQKALAQAASPYSRYGLGYINSTVFSSNRGMADVSAAISSPVNINYTNPASYADILLATFEAGGKLEGVTIASHDSTYNAVNGGVGHVAFGLPILRGKWGMSFGILPYSTLNYHFAQNNVDSNYGGSTYLYSGKGSLYQAYFGNGVRIKDFSIGVNLGLIFGKLDYERDIIFADTVLALNTSNLTTMVLRGFTYNVGVQYKKRIYKAPKGSKTGRDLYFSAGAYGSSGSKLYGTYSNSWSRYAVNTAGTSTIIDTLQSAYNSPTSIKIPFHFGTGVAVGNEAFWQVGVDFRYQNWSSYTSVLNNGPLTNSWKLSIGGTITPNGDSRKFYNKVQYKMGVYYGKSEYLYNNIQLDQVGGTFGFAIPVKRSFARINLIADIGTRGTQAAIAIRETYYKFSFGFTLNDQWFVKRKYD